MASGITSLGGQCSTSRSEASTGVNYGRLEELEAKGEECVGTVGSVQEWGWR